MAMKTNKMLRSLSFTSYHSLELKLCLLEIFDLEVMIDGEGFYAVELKGLSRDRNFVLSRDEDHD